MTDDLLKPTLTASPVEPLYSSGALLAAGFLGGGFAVVALAGANMQRVRRLNREWPWLVLGFAVSFVVILLAINLSDGFDSPETRKTGRIANRAVGLALWGLYYYLHRQHYRAMATFGTKSPSPVLPVIGAILLSLLCTLIVFGVTLGFGSGALG